MFFFRNISDKKKNDFFQHLLSLKMVYLFLYKTKQIKMVKTLKVITLFSGVGTQELGLKKVGVDYEVINYCEFDKKISKCYELIHGVSPDKNLGDITKLDVKKYYRQLKEDGNVDIDLMFSSFPCQSFSNMGKRKGFNDPTKGNLFDCSHKLISKVQPKIVIFENVKGITNKKFNITENVVKKMEDIGYKCHQSILNSCNYGVPQSRERWFMVCVKQNENLPSNFHFPFPIPLTKKVKDILVEGVVRKCSKRIQHFILKDQYKKKYDSKNGMKKVFDGRTQGYFTSGYTSSRIMSIEGVSPTLITKNDTHFWEIGGKLVPLERWRLMGMDDDDFKKLKQNGMSDTIIHKICGNGIVVDVCSSIFKQMLEDGVLIGEDGKDEKDEKDGKVEKDKKDKKDK